MHHWECFPFPFGFLFFLLLIGLFIANLISWRRCRWGGRHRFHDDALLILDKRLASGDIDIQEYQTLKDVLKNKGK